VNRQSTPSPGAFTRGEGWVLAQFVFFAALAMFPPAGPAWPPGVRLLALPLGAAGLVLAGSGIVALGSSLTVFPRPKAEGRLIQQGIYRVVRHPIYGGVILLALAWAVWRTSLLHLTLAAILAIFFRAKARREEHWLIERFPEYADYRRRVRAFIPWLY